MSPSPKRPLIGITLDHEVAPTYSGYPWYALRENYSLAVEKAGGTPILLPYMKDRILQYIDILDGILISGNDADIDPQLYHCDVRHPSVKTKDRRTEFELELAYAALKSDLPVFGICNGLQVINVVRGGTLIQHIPEHNSQSLVHQQQQPKHEPSHTIILKENTLLYKIINTDNIQVNSTHHQAIDQIGKSLQLSAMAEDGIIEGIEATDQKFCLGVQWHPEYLTTSYDHALFKAFIEACRS